MIIKYTLLNGERSTHEYGPLSDLIMPLLDTSPSFDSLAYAFEDMVLEPNDNNYSDDLKYIDYCKSSVDLLLMMSTIFHRDGKEKNLDNIIIMLSRLDYRLLWLSRPNNEITIDTHERIGIADALCIVENNYKEYVPNEIISGLIGEFEDMNNGVW